ncbi:metallopeptidase family protein [Nocardioides gansuensis]
MPDRITIYRRPTCEVCRGDQEVAEQVRRTGSTRSVTPRHRRSRLRELGW